MENLTNFLHDKFVFSEHEDSYTITGDQVFVDENNIVASALICREVNASGLFEKQMVKLGKRGDVIILGFDDMIEIASVFEKKIGNDGEVVMSVKRGENKRCYVYMNGKRITRSFASVAASRRYIDQLHQQLTIPVETDALDYADEYEH